MTLKETDINKKHNEAFYRFSIIESYTSTDYYISHKHKAQKWG